MKSEFGVFLFGFPVCVGSGVKAEAGSGEERMSLQVVVAKQLLQVSHETHIHFSSCCLVWSSAIYKSKDLRMTAWVQCWSEVGMGFFASLPKEGKFQSLVQLLCWVKNSVELGSLKRIWVAFSIWICQNEHTLQTLELSLDMLMEYIFLNKTKTWTYCSLESTAALLDNSVILETSQAKIQEIWTRHLFV